MNNSSEISCICELFSTFYGISSQEMTKQSTQCEPEPMDSEDILFLLYTSGSTGQPKGVVHTQAGYLLYAKLTHKVRLSYWYTFFSQIFKFLITNIKFKPLI